MRPQPNSAQYSQLEKRDFNRGKASRVSALGCIAIAAGLLIVVVLCGQHPSPTALLSYVSKQKDYITYCKMLGGVDVQLCDNYAHALGGQKFSAAANWRKKAPATYECSGITAECLHNDMHSSATGTSCAPLATGAECEAGVCQAGRCSSYKQQQDQQQQQQQQQPQQPQQQPQQQDQQQQEQQQEQQEQQQQEQQQQEQQQQEQLQEQQQDEEDEDAEEDAADYDHNTAEQYDASQGPEPRILAEQADKGTQNTQVKQAAVAQSSLYSSMSRQDLLTMLKKGPNPNWQTAQATVNANQKWSRVMDGFLATSHAWQRIHDYADARMVQAWAHIFNTISPTPVIRIGGADQDRMTQLPDQQTWNALKTIKKYTNAKFVIGLPLWPKNSVDLSKKIMAAAKKNLGDAVIVYELGNEPEFWPTGLGGWDAKGKWKKGFDAYAAWFDRVARAINPCSTNNRMLSGPGWGNLNTQPTKWTAAILYKGKDCYLKEMNIHYYPYINNETVTARELLDQRLQDFGIDKYKEYHRIVTDGEKLGIRISETNSLYGGGRPDLSDTLVGALWVADALFAFALAGAKGFHLHWGIGGDPSGTLGQPNTGVQTNFHFDVRPGEAPVPYPSIHAPWYGYLLWTVAASGGYNKRADANFVPASMDNKGKCGANIKVWALKADNGQVRIVLINKDELISCNVRVNVPSNYCGKAAILTRMVPNNRGMYAKGDIYFQGQTYENAGYSGRLQGKYESFGVPAQKFSDGKCGFKVPVPAASAALIMAR